MITKRYTLSFLWLAVVPLTLIAHADMDATSASTRPDLPAHALPKSKAGNLVVGNCDGKTSVEIPGHREGQPLTDAEARAVSQDLMNAWQRQNPGAHWEVASASEPQHRTVESTREPQSEPSSTGDKTSDAKQESGAPKLQQGIYSNFTAQDRKTWEIEQGKLVATGKQIFHSAALLGSKTAISCDMCHPNAANTHPETYPKYQVQLQRVAMLRDMINWCIENPIKGAMLKDEDPKMKALEAYIISQRSGTPLSPGKH